MPVGATLERRDLEEIASLFLGQMTPLLNEREAEIKKSLSGEFDAAIQRHIDGVNGRIAEIETKGKRPVSGVAHAEGMDADTQRAERVAAFKAYVKRGYFGMPRDMRDALVSAEGQDRESLQTKAMQIRAETKAMSIADDTLGGYFVLPEIVQNEIIKTQILFSPVRQLAKVQQTANNSVEIPVRKTTLTAGWVAETGTRTETTGQSYGKAVIPTHEMYGLVIFSRQMLEDAYFDLEAELQGDVAEQFGVLEGQAFVGGNGIGKPMGFLSNVATNVIGLGTPGTLKYADIANVFFQLKPAYRFSPNCKWVLNQQILNVIRQIVDAQGRPIFQPFGESGLSAANPPTILGKPYVEATDMPSTVATTNRILAVGDFGKGYRFVDRIQMSVQRLEELYAASGQVGLLIHKRVGGEIVLDEALSVLKNS